MPEMAIPFLPGSNLVCPVCPAPGIQHEAECYNLFAIFSPIPQPLSPSPCLPAFLPYSFPFPPAFAIPILFPSPVQLNKGSVAVTVGNCFLDETGRG